MITIKKEDWLEGQINESGYYLIKSDLGSHDMLKVDIEEDYMELTGSYSSKWSDFKQRRFNSFCFVKIEVEK